MFACKFFMKNEMSFEYFVKFWRLLLKYLFVGNSKVKPLFLVALTIEFSVNLLKRLLHFVSQKLSKLLNCLLEFQIRQNPC